MNENKEQGLVLIPKYEKYMEYYILKMDIKKYFPNINRDILMQIKNGKKYS